MIKIIYQRLDKQGLELIRFSGTKQLEQCSVVEIAHLFRMAFIKMSAITQIRRPWLVHQAREWINVLLSGCISIKAMRLLQAVLIIALWVVVLYGINKLFKFNWMF